MFAGQQIGTVDLVAAEDANMSMLLYLQSAVKRMTASAIFKILIAIVVILIAAYIALYIRANRRRKKNRELKIFKYNELKQKSKKKNRKW